MSEPPFVLFDIGGTKMRFAVSLNGKNFDNSRIVPTPHSFNEGMSTFSQIVTELLSGKKANLAVGGIAGSLNIQKSEMYNSPHLPDWAGKPLKQEIGKITKCQVFLENDTALVGLGEAGVGAGKGYGIVVYITVSTGVNGVRVVNGKIDASVFGFEIGHQIIDFDSSSVYLHEGRGELEDYIGGSALEKKYKLPPLEITDSEIWEKAARSLAYGLNNTILHWSPEVIILGGSVAHKIPLEKTKMHLKDILQIFPEIPVIEAATLGEMGGIYGGLFYIKSLSL